MVHGGAIGIAALLSTAALGYLVCVKANAEKKGSNIRAVGLGLGALIIIIGILGSSLIIFKTGYLHPKKFMCNKMLMMDMCNQPGMPRSK